MFPLRLKLTHSDQWVWSIVFPTKSTHVFWIGLRVPINISRGILRWVTTKMAKWTVSNIRTASNIRNTLYVRYCISLYFIGCMYVSIYIYSNVYQLTGGTSLICAHRHIEQTCKYDQICSNDRSIGKSPIKLVTSMYVLRPPRFLCKIPKFTGKTATVIL